MRASGPGDRVIELIQHRHLRLRQKVGRAQVRVVVKSGERYAAPNRGVGRDPGNELSCRLRQIERLLLPIGRVAHPAEAKVVEEIRSKNVRPAQYKAGSFQSLIAPC